MNFWKGFEKRALMSTKGKELTTGMLLDNFVPLGTTGHTMLADRPEGHSRLKEWASRVAGQMGGGVVGGGLGSLLALALATRASNLQSSIPAPLIIALPGIGAYTGHVLGSHMGHKYNIDKYYDEQKKLKPEYE